MTSINLLHLTDFHQGMGREQHYIWPNVKNIFFKDLQSLYEQCGGWDLVLFTGDLTQKGTEEEFNQIDRDLDELWDHLVRIQKTSPYFLAVPGNHDLVRPSSNDELNVLKDFSTTKSVRNLFWNNADSAPRKLVTQAFTNYRNWWTNQRYRPQDNIQLSGILPGDFSYIFEKDGISLGIIGLNTSFLQLDNDNYKEKLALHVSQFNKVCDGSGPDWARKRNACLLVTHHPPSWLMKEQDQDLGEEFVPDYIQAHFCGHLHESRSELGSVNAGSSRFTLQGRSLCGLEKIKDGLERSHGYSAIQIKRSESGVELIIWPREARKQGGSNWGIVPDYAFKLNQGVEQLLLKNIIKQRILLKDWKKLHQDMQAISQELLNLRIEIIDCQRKTHSIVRRINQQWDDYDANNGVLAKELNKHYLRQRIENIIILQEISQDEVKNLIIKTGHPSKIEKKITPLNEAWKELVEKFIDNEKIVKEELQEKFLDNESIKKEEELQENFLSNLHSLEYSIGIFLVFVDIEMQRLIKNFEQNLDELEKKSNLINSISIPIKG